nr:hypothetical protein [Tanacetum cinerariifolium]
MHKAFPLPVMEFPLLGEVPTASEESSHCQKKRDATAKKIALLLKSSSNCTTSDGTGKKKGRTVTLTIDDMQNRKNDVKTRTTLLLSLPDEHQLQFKGSETLEQTFNRLQRSSDLDTMSLDDLYNHLKVYESEVQKKSEPNSQNMAFISSAKHSSRNEEVNTASVSTASANVSTASIRVPTISQDTACAYIASQSSSSQIKFKNINQIDKDDMEEMDIKLNMALLSMRADRFWKKTGKKIRIQGTDVAGFDKSKVECFNCHKMGHFARKCRAPRSQDRGRRDNYRQGSKVEEQAPKVLMAIDGVGWDWSYMENDEENHALIADEETPIEFALMAKTNAESEELELIKKEKEGLDTKLTGFQTASKDLDNLLESQRLDKNKEGLGYNVVPPYPAQIYSPPKKDMSWTGLSECADDTTEASPSTISPKPFIKFVKANDSPTKSKTDKVETAKKPPVKYAKQYRKSTKKPNVRGNKRNWNNLKSHQLVRSQFRAPWVPTVNRKFSTVNRRFPTANRKFPTGGIKFSTTDMGKKGKAETYPTFLIMSHLMEDMYLLVKEDARLLAKELSKPQYGNFRAEGSETLEQTFSRLQVIIGQL